MTRTFRTRSPVLHLTERTVQTPAEAEDVVDPKKAPPNPADSAKRARKLVLDGVCVSNLLEDARKFLAASTDARELINEESPLDGKPLLLAVVEEGHVDVIELLIAHGARLESRDRDGNTALLRALHFGRGIVAERLLAAGADLSTANSRCENVGDIARASLELQKKVPEPYMRCFILESVL